LADNVQIKFGADVSGALSSLDTLNQAMTAATDPAARLARTYGRAFDQIGAGWRSAVVGLVAGTRNFQTAALQVARSVERGFIDLAETTLSHAAAGPLAGLLGLAAPASGQGVGDVLGAALSHSLSGVPEQIGGAAASTAKTAALAANTAALSALTAALGTSAAAGGASALGSLGNAASIAGGTAPSAARGWALPNFTGARPALLHAREMVLPASISEGLQNMIGQGGANGAGGDMHLHFHGPSDGPAVERWFSGLMARNPGVVRNMLRSNALTPRTL